MGRPYRRAAAAETGVAARREAASIRQAEVGSRAPSARRYPCPVTPEQLSDLIVAVPGGPLRRGRDHAARRRARDGHGRAPAAEGSRRLRHQRRAPARQAGRAAAARLRRAGRRRGCEAADGIAAVEVAGPGLPQHQRRRRCPGRGRRRHRRGRCGVRRLRGGPASRRSTSSSSRPTRPARSRWPAPGGRRSATPWPGCSRRAATSSPASTTSTTTAPRSTGSAGRCCAAARHEPTPEDGYPGQYITEIAEQVVAAHPEAPGLPDDEALEAFRAYGVGADVRRDQADAARLPGAVRRLLPRERPLRVRRHRPRARPAPRARQHLREGRRGLAAHREVRRRQGPRDRQVRRSRRLHLRRRGVLPRQAGARLRPLHHPARRRPPRLRRPDDGAVRGVRRRARASTSRSSSARWSTCSATARSCGWASAPATSSRCSTWSRRSASTPPATRWCATRSRPTSTSTSTSGPRPPATTRSSTCSTPTPGSPRSCATPRSSASSPAPTPSCSPTRRRASCCARSPSSRGSCNAATTLREPHRVARYLEDTAASYHRFYDSCRVLPMGDEEPVRPAPRPAPAGRGHADRAGQRARPARGLRPRADVTAGCDAHPRGRLGARRRRAARAELAARAARPERPGRRRCGRPPAHKVDGDLVVGGVSLPELVADVNTPAYVLDEADFRARARAFREAFAGVRRLLRRQGLPLHDGRALGRRGGALPRRLLRRRADRRPARRLRPGPDRLPRQHQDRARAAPRRRRGRRPDHRRLVRRDRAARAGDREPARRLDTDRSR